MLICHLATVCLAGEPSPGPRTPKAEQGTFRLADPRLSIELAAAEPELRSPVAMAWDADGALYVAEMIDYPVAPAAGQIRRLEDRNGDGRYERATVFADGLRFPNGVLPCFGGVLVTAAPDILFLSDRDGDGRADDRKVILTGFGEGNTQLRVNGLFWGLDNWIYAANGRSEGEVRAPGWPTGKTVSIRRRDVRFRFRPDTNDLEVEAISGFSQFGLAHDDWGNRFPSWNTIPIRHVVLEQSALVRNPFLAETSSVASILDEADGGRVYSISPVQTRFNRESVDYFNASCGPTIFCGDGLPPNYRGNAFVCEPLTSLVHRRVLESVGCTFRASRVEVQREFLAATDPAFRPVNLSTGPDGALYIVDMYREMVEHPDFVPAELRKTIEFRRWHDRGRIWRVRSADPKKSAGAGVGHVALGKASVDKLVQDLNHPVGWWRDTAQRLLVERQDRRAVPLLQAQLRTAANPLGRIHALWTLAGLDALDTAMLEQGARDAHPGVRENALRASHQITAPARRLSLRNVLKLAEDPSIRVRLQAALALGRHVAESQAALHALVILATRDAADPWMRLAIQSDLAETALPFLKAWIKTYPRVLEAATGDQLSFLSEIASIIGVRRRDPELRVFLELVESAGRGQAEQMRGLLGRLALLAGLGAGMDRSGPPLHAWLKDFASKGQAKPDWLELLWTAAREMALSDHPATERVMALEVLVRGEPGLAGPIMPRLLKSDQPAIVQSAAARAVGRVGGAKLAAQILDSWSELALGSRRELCSALLGSPAAAAVFVKAMESNKVAAVELDAASRDALLRLADPALRKRAEVLLARSAPANRSAVVARYQAALRLPGDVSRGTGLFTKNCQTCHLHQGLGHRVGPDLSGIAGRLPAVLLNDILDPNRDVAPDFVALTVATERGQVLSGLLVEDTGSSLKLRKADGVEETVLRSETAEIRSSGRSLMPEGLEQSLNLQEMADLLAFLRSGSSLHTSKQHAP